MNHANILYRISIINLLFVIAFASFDIINMYDNHIAHIKNYIFIIIKDFSFVISFVVFGFSHLEEIILRCNSDILNVRAFRRFFI